MTLTEKAHSLVNKFYEHAKDSEVINFERKKSDRLKLYAAKQCAVIHLELMSVFISDNFKDSSEQHYSINQLIREINRIREI
jgi:hypothetical protein